MAKNCPDTVKDAIAQWHHVIASDKHCHGPHNRRVCEPSAFPAHFGNIDVARSHEFLKRAHTNITKIPATPWLTIGDFAFTGNDYLDFYIYSLFFKERSEAGTYVEMGGSNGVHASNTYFLDHALGWAGELIEPTPCGVCQLPFNRPRATNIHAGVCDTRQMRNFDFMAAFCGTSQKKGCEFDNIIPCEPMSDLLARGNLTHIDFLSLDIETEFKSAFNTIDFEKTPISVFLMECNVPNSRADGLHECEQMMADKGYESIWVTRQDILAWKPESRPKICI